MSAEFRIGQAVPRHQIDHEIASRQREAEQRAALLCTKARHQIGRAQPQAGDDLPAVAA